MTEEVEGLYTTAEGTRYISEQVAAHDKKLSPRGVLKYVRNPDFHLLRGTLKGRTLLFTRAELDEFINWYLEAVPRPGVKVGSTWSDKRRQAEPNSSPYPPED